jgi:RecJ-like exonuclease
MRISGIALAVIFSLLAGQLRAAERPVVKSIEAAQQVGKAATVYGRVIEVRRVANGPIIFELDGVPTAPAFRALVYPMAAPRFGADPENVYLGQIVEVTGVVILRNKLPQMWLSDPSFIRLHKTEKSSAPTPTPPPKVGVGV